MESTDEQVPAGPPPNSQPRARSRLSSKTEAKKVISSAFLGVPDSDGSRINAQSAGRMASEST
jgi:hypothetical protein